MPGIGAGYSILTFGTVEDTDNDAVRLVPFAPFSSAIAEDILVMVSVRSVLVLYLEGETRRTLHQRRELRLEELPFGEKISVVALILIGDLFKCHGRYYH